MSPQTPQEVLEGVRAAVQAALYTTAPDPLADGALDSVGMIQLLAELEDRFGIAIPAEDVRPENFASVAALAALVARVSGR